MKEIATANVGSRPGVASSGIGSPIDFAQQGIFLDHASLGARRRAKGAKPQKRELEQNSLWIPIHCTPMNRECGLQHLRFGRYTSK